MNDKIINRIKALAIQHVRDPKDDGDYTDYWNHIVEDGKVYTYNVFKAETWQVNAYPNIDNEIISDEEVYFSL